MAKSFLEEISPEQGIVVNDIHSQLNATHVHKIFRPLSTGDLSQAIQTAAAAKLSVAIAGGRHAMGGQQFAAGGCLIDTSLFTSVLSLDAEAGLVTVQGGITWGALIEQLKNMQLGRARQWVIKQKPSGADDISIAGSISANAHGRGLTWKPLVGDVESLTVVDAHGEEHFISRTENQDLFRLVIGGYGMFGAIGAVTLRLQERAKLQRHVEVIRIADLMSRFDSAIEDGFVYGDFQFDIENGSEEFLTRGIFAAYKPVAPDTVVPDQQRVLSIEEWQRLLHLAHVDKRRAFEVYSDHYLQSHGQIYYSDVHQLSKYIDHYHLDLDKKLQAQVPATEIITELYVPRNRLANFMCAAATECRRLNTNIIYGTIRLIEKDDETFLPWARERYACIIFNLHTEHSQDGMNAAQTAFKKLIDLAIERQGSFYLTYHRFADVARINACYPQFKQWLALKREADPEERFQSNWYRHYRDLFA
ncbi:MAG: FAD-binding oxidoreductase [Candidatus Obscuribacterales bacterium]